MLTLTVALLVLCSAVQIAICEAAVRNSSTLMELCTVAALPTLRSRCSNPLGTLGSVATECLAVGSAGSGVKFDDELHVMVGQQPELAKLLRDVAMRNSTGRLSFASFTTAREWLTSLSGLARRTNITHDVLLLEPSVLPTMQAAGVLLDFRPFVNRKEVHWHETLAHFRRTAELSADGTYVPLGGLVWSLFYRHDLLDAAGLGVPATWGQLASAAQALNGTGDGAWGFCNVPIEGTGCVDEGMGLAAIWASHGQTLGLRQALLFDPTTMDPRTDADAMHESLKLWHALTRWSPGSVAASGLNVSTGVNATCSPLRPGPSADLFARGRCALLLAPAIQYKRFLHPSASASTSGVPASAVRVAALPGTTHVMDPSTGRLAECTYSLCPHADEAPDDAASAAAAWRLINRTPFMPVDPIGLAVSTLPPLSSRALSVETVIEMIQPDVMWQLVTDPQSPIPPYRYEHFSSSGLSQWRKAGYTTNENETHAQLRSWLALTADTIRHPNLFTFPFMQRISSYGAALQVAAHNVSQGGATVDFPTIAARLEASLHVAFNPATFSRFGSLQQEYVTAIGRPDEAWPSPPSIPPPPQVDRIALAKAQRPRGTPEGGGGDRAAIGIACGCIGFALLVVGVTLAYNQLVLKRGWLRSKDPGIGPESTLVITDMEASTVLWEELDSYVMDRAMNVHHSALRQCVVKWHGYESGYEGDSFTVAFHNASSAAQFALDLQRALMHADWPDEVLHHDACRVVHVAQKKRLASALKAAALAHQRMHAQALAAAVHEEFAPPSEAHKAGMGRTFSAAMRRIDMLSGISIRMRHTSHAGSGGGHSHGHGGVAATAPGLGSSGYMADHMSFGHRAARFLTLGLSVHGDSASASVTSATGGRRRLVNTASCVDANRGDTESSDAGVSRQLNNGRTAATYSGRSFATAGTDSLRSISGMAQDAHQPAFSGASASAAGSAAALPGAGTGALALASGVSSSGPLAMAASARSSPAVTAGPSPAQGHMFGAVSSLRRGSYSDLPGAGSPCRWPSSLQEVDEDAAIGHGGGSITERAQGSGSRNAHAAQPQQQGSEVLPMPPAAPLASLPPPGPHLLMGLHRHASAPQVAPSNVMLLPREDFPGAPHMREIEMDQFDMAGGSGVTERDSGASFLGMTLAAAGHMGAGGEGVMGLTPVALATLREGAVQAAADGSFKALERLSECTSPSEGTLAGGGASTIRGSDRTLLAELVRRDFGMGGTRARRVPPASPSSYGEEFSRKWQEVVDPSLASSVKAVLVFRGPRVRVGMTSGIQNENEIIRNHTSGRTKYSGAISMVTKAIADSAHGGMTFMSIHTRNQLAQEFLANNAIVWRMGDYILAHPHIPATLFQITETSLVLRAVIDRPLTRIHAMLLPGVLTAPLGYVAYILLQMAGAEALLGSGQQDVCLEAFSIWQAVTYTQLQRFKGHVVQQGAGQVAAVFPNAYLATMYGLCVQAQMFMHPWSQQLLATDECGPIRLELPAGESVVAMQGPRVRGLVHYGAASSMLHPISGRLEYAGGTVDEVHRRLPDVKAGAVLVTPEAAASLRKYYPDGYHPPHSGTSNDPPNSQTGGGARSSYDLRGFNTSGARSHSGTGSQRNSVPDLSEAMSLMRGAAGGMGSVTTQGGLAAAPGASAPYAPAGAAPSGGRRSLKHLAGGPPVSASGTATPQGVGSPAYLPRNPPSTAPSQRRFSAYAAVGGSSLNAHSRRLSQAHASAQQAAMTLMPVASEGRTSANWRLAHMIATQQGVDQPSPAHSTPGTGDGGASHLGAPRLLDAHASQLRERQDGATRLSEMAGMTMPGGSGAAAALIEGGAAPRALAQNGLPPPSPAAAFLGAATGASGRGIGPTSASVIVGRGDAAGAGTSMSPSTAAEAAAAGVYSVPSSPPAHSSRHHNTQPPPQQPVRTASPYADFLFTSAPAGAGAASAMRTLLPQASGQLGGVKFATARAAAIGGSAGVGGDGPGSSQKGKSPSSPQLPQFGRKSRGSDSGASTRHLTSPQHSTGLDGGLGAGRTGSMAHRHRSFTLKRSPLAVSSGGAAASSVPHGAHVGMGPGGLSLPAPPAGSSQHSSHIHSGLAQGGSREGAFRSLHHSNLAAGSAPPGLPGHTHHNHHVSFSGINNVGVVDPGVPSPSSLACTPGVPSFGSPPNLIDAHYTTSTYCLFQLQSGVGASQPQRQQRRPHVPSAPGGTLTAPAAAPPRDLDHFTYGSPCSGLVSPTFTEPEPHHSWALRSPALPMSGGEQSEIQVLSSSAGPSKRHHDSPVEATAGAVLDGASEGLGVGGAAQGGRNVAAAAAQQLEMSNTSLAHAYSNAASSMGGGSFSQHRERLPPSAAVSGPASTSGSFPVPAAAADGGLSGAATGGAGGSKRRASIASGIMYKLLNRNAASAAAIQHSPRSAGQQVLRRDSGSYGSTNSTVRTSNFADSLRAASITVATGLRQALGGVGGGGMNGSRRAGFDDGRLPTLQEATNASELQPIVHCQLQLIPTRLAARRHNVNTSAAAVAAAAMRSSSAGNNKASGSSGVKVSSGSGGRGPSTSDNISDSDRQTPSTNNNTLASGLAGRLNSMTAAASGVGTGGGVGDSDAMYRAHLISIDPDLIMVDLLMYLSRFADPSTANDVSSMWFHDPSRFLLDDYLPASFGALMAQLALHKNAEDVYERDGFLF